MGTDALIELERQVEEAERRAAALRKMAEGVRELGDEGIEQLKAIMSTNGNGKPAVDEEPKELVFRVAEGPVEVPAPAERKPRGREALLLIMDERPGIWRLADLRSEMQARGWFTSPKGVEVGMWRLAESGIVRRVGKGRYEYRPHEREEGAIASVAAPWR